MASTELDDLLDRAEALNLHAAVDALTDAEARKLQAQNAATDSESLAALAHLRWRVWRAEHPSELPLDNDAMACLARGLDGAGLLAFSLSCKQFNAARKAAPDPMLRTLTRSTLRSASLWKWALSVGCPSDMFPCWAEAHSLKAGNLNGRVCSILGPPDGDDNRCPVEFDTGRGGVEAVSAGSQVDIPGAAMWNGVCTARVVDLSNSARKKVRLSNLRILDDSEMLSAVRIMCKGELQEALRDEAPRVMRDEAPRVPGFRSHDKLYQTQGTALEWERGRCGLLPFRLPLMHSAVVFMRSCEEDEDKVPRSTPFKPWYVNSHGTWTETGIGLMGGIRGMRATGNRDPGGGWRWTRLGHEKSFSEGRGAVAVTEQTDDDCFNVETYTSPLMALCGRKVFIQPVGVRRRTAVERQGAPSTLSRLERSEYGSNGCVAHLMTAPGNDPLDHARWLSGGGSVVAFMTQQDLTPRDVEHMWRLSVKNDPNEMSAEEYVAKFTAANYDRHVRICNATDETMSRVHVTDDGVGYYDGERL